MFLGHTIFSNLHGGTEQDKEIGKDLVDEVKKRDLVMRGMGYFIIKEFALIEQKGAFWLSRVPANVIVTNESGVKIEKVLSALKGGTWEGGVHVGRCKLPPSDRVFASAMIEAVCDRTKTIDTAQINQVLLQPH